MKRGMSIVEIMVFIAALLIAVIGASGYRYLSTLEIKKSDQQLAAGRTAMLLCESWKGTGGSTAYNPLSDTGLGLDIAAATSVQAPSMPDGYTLRGYYRVTYGADNDNEDNFTCYLTLSYRSVNCRLKVLNVAVQWLSNERQANDQNMVNRKLYMSTLITTLGCY